MLTSAAEASTSNTPQLFIYAIVIFCTAFFLLRAWMNYGSYKRSILPYVYDNYLIDYYWHLTVRQNVSSSGKLKSLLGFHRIVYSNISNREGEIVNRLMVVIHPKGIVVVSHLDPLGELHGSNDGSWYVKRTSNEGTKNFKIDNPVTHLREYDKHIKPLIDNRDTDKIIAIAPASDISHVHCSIPVVHYDEITDLIAKSDCGYGLNEQEIEEIYAKLGGKK
ncbi:MAG: hypothetical protein IJS38_04085 [Erysipelotrichaceae bacterium]|nr:hypothetical protein [Erysipelotrichaceae bacterium]